MSLESKEGTPVAMADNSSQKPLLDEPKKVGIDNTEGNVEKNGAEVKPDEQEMKLLKANGEKSPDKDTIIVLEDKAENGGHAEKLQNGNIAEKKGRKAFDVKCLVISLLVLILMVIAAVSAILVHTYDDKISGNFKFAHIFTDHMVLQASPAKVVIWGYATEANVSVEVVLKKMEGDAGKTYYSTVIQTARGLTWSATLDPVEAASQDEPYEIIATIDDKVKIPEARRLIKIKDVLFGDVWVCSGDEKFSYTAMKNTTENKRFKNNNIRLLTLNPSTSDRPRFNVVNVKLHWSKPSKETSAQTPIICLLMAKHLQKRTNRSIGLISSINPSSFIYQWIPPTAAEECKLREEFNIGNIYNSMLHPLSSIPCRGLVWYHGTQDAKTSSPNYNCSQHHFFSTWTSHHPTSHVAVIQMPAPNHSGNHLTYNYADIRWKQTNNYGYFPNQLHNNTILIPTIDLQWNPHSGKDSGVSHSNGEHDASTTKSSSKTSTSHIVAKRLSNGILKSFYHVHDVAFDLVLPYGYKFSTTTMNALYGDDNNENEEEEEEDDVLAVRDSKVKKKRETGDNDGMEGNEEEEDREMRVLEVTFDNEVTQHGEDNNSFEVCCSLNTSLSCSFSFPKVSYAPGRKWVGARIIDVTSKLVIIDLSDCPDHVVAVRYLWKDIPCQSKKCPLQSPSDLPIMPFVRPVLSDVTEFTRFKERPVSLV